jgi:hypothetical protein
MSAAKGVVQGQEAVDVVGKEYIGFGFSGDTPFVLRRIEDKDSFALVSSAWVDGVMYGEALETRDKSKDRDFIID